MCLVLLASMGWPQPALPQVPAKATPAARPAPARPGSPTTYRNQPAAPAEDATARPLPLSRQDRQAYENCPNPRRYGPQARRKKLVRIW